MKKKITHCWNSYKLPIVNHSNVPNIHFHNCSLSWCRTVNSKYVYGFKPSLVVK